jgi:hypothetical protein
VHCIFIWNANNIHRMAGKPRPYPAVRGSGAAFSIGETFGDQIVYNSNQIVYNSDQIVYNSV